MLATLEIPAHGEHTLVVILGQADDRKEAEAVIAKYQDVRASPHSLEDTRRWWLSLMDTLQVQTNQPQFDRYLDWLKYQPWPTTISSQAQGSIRPAGRTVFAISFRTLST